MTSFRRIGLLCAASAVIVPAAAQATYSIVAADQVTRQVGGAVTSCVAPSGVDLVYGSAPGRGAVASQAAASRAGRDRAVQLLSMDVAPEQIIASITAAAFDAGAAQRQYGVVDLQGRAAGHSGAGNGNFANDVQGQAGEITYSIQGNILTGAAVLSQAQAAFQRDACDLAERLMDALEGGAANGQGDRRCTPSGAPSDSAFIEVDRPGEPAGTYLRLSVVAQRLRSPLPALRAQFETWRRTHPCPMAGVDGGPGPQQPDASADTTAGGGNTGRDGAAADRSDASPAPGGAGGSTPPRPSDASSQGADRPADRSGGAGGAGGGPTGSGGGGAAGGNAGASGTTGGPSMPGMTPPPRGEGGCQCVDAGLGSPGVPPVLLAAAAFVLMLMRRRRRV
jgi:uncharacterized Ntn-hydrolase superfamily protein